ncbi:MAG: hypothetical protein HFJ47_01640 [Clostridia bacterium]|nr:hypothetical protein [Clostridia bacterium]
MEKAIEIKYNEEIEELILKINLLAYRISAKTKHDVFARYYSHVNYLEIEVYINSWEIDKKANYKKSINLNKETTKEELQEIIEYLEKLED